MTILIELNLNHKGELYCHNYLHSFEMKNQINHMKMYVSVKMFVITPSEDTKI